MKKIAIVFCLMTCAFAFAQGSPDSSGLIGTPTGSLGSVGLLNCDGVDTVYEQDFDPAGFGGASTGDEENNFTDFEGVVDGGGALTTLPAGTTGNMRFWALSIEFDPAAGFVATCTEDDDAGTPYNISFFDDNAGLPGNMLGSTTATLVSSIDTGIPFAFTTVREIDVMLDTPLDNAGVTHIGIQRQTGQNAANGNMCLALIVDEQVVGTFDDNANQFDGAVFTATADDFPICLGAPAETLPPPPAVPALNTFGLLLLAFVLMLGTALVMRRRT